MLVQAFGAQWEKDLTNPEITSRVAEETRWAPQLGAVGVDGRIQIAGKLRTDFSAAAHRFARSPQRGGPLDLAGRGVADDPLALE